ncbi:glycosyltransferase family 4 protein [Candidatus Woesebacteria bacterium]|nr:glycosyltransferase family 4 protein [Candidatus Woesebacteria bacterium]
MRIFMLTPYLPYPLLSGGQVRTYNLLKKISEEHDVTLFSLIKHEDEKQYLPELEKYCRKVRVFKRTSKPWHPRNILLAGLTPYPFVVTRNMVMSVKAAIAQELSSEEYDLIHVETFYMMPNIPETSIPTLLVEQTIEYLGYEKFSQKITKQYPFLRPILNIDIAKIKYWEKQYWQSCDQLITVSEDDRDFIEEVMPNLENIAVVSNGVDIQFFEEKKKQLNEHPTVLFVGTFNWLPNVEAVEFLVEEVWPRIRQAMPEVHLRIAGASPTTKIRKYSENDDHITVTGRVPDIRDEYAQANVLLAPVFSGKGTRYKVLEAMATRTPVIGTGIALEGIGAEPDKEFLLADTAQEMADQTVRLLQDKKLQQKLGAAGKKFVEQHFGWESISEELLDIYQEAAQ